MGMYWWLCKADQTIGAVMDRDQLGLFRAGKARLTAEDTTIHKDFNPPLSREAMGIEVGSNTDLQLEDKLLGAIERGFDVFAGTYYLGNKGANKIQCNNSKTAEQQMRRIVLLMPEMKYLRGSFKNAIDEINTLVAGDNEIPVISRTFRRKYPAPFCQYAAAKYLHVIPKSTEVVVEFGRLRLFFEHPAYVRHLTYFVVLVDRADVMTQFIEQIGQHRDMFSESLYAVLEARVPDNATNYNDLVDALFKAAREDGIRTEKFGMYSCVLNDRVVEPMDIRLATILVKHEVRLHAIAYSVLCKEHSYMGDIDAFLCLSGLV